MTWGVAFSPDGKKIAAGSEDGTIHLWDVKDALRRTRLPCHPKRVAFVGFLADGSTLATTCGDSFVRLWNAETGSPDGLLELRGKSCVDLAFSPSQQALMVVTMDRSVHRFKVANGKGQTILSAHTEFKEPGGVVPSEFPGKDTRLLREDFSAEGNLVATDMPCADRDDLVRTQVWDVERRQELFRATRSVTGPIMSPFVFSPDGTTLAWVEAPDGKSAVLVLDLVTRDLRRIQTGNGWWTPCLAFSPDGKTIAVGNATCSIDFLDMSTGRVRETLLGHRGGVTVVAFSPDGRTLASGSKTGEVKLWDAASAQELMSLEGHTGEITSAVFSADGTRLATAGEASDGSGEVNVWHAPKDVKFGETTEPQ